MKITTKAMCFVSLLSALALPLSSLANTVTDQNSSAVPKFTKLAWLDDNDYYWRSDRWRPYYENYQGVPPCCYYKRVCDDYTCYRIYRGCGYHHHCCGYHHHHWFF